MTRLKINLIKALDKTIEENPIQPPARLAERVDSQTQSARCPARNSPARETSF